MKSYNVFFKGIFQGTYAATSWCAAMDKWALDYGATVKSAHEQFGAYPTFG